MNEYLDKLRFKTLFSNLYNSCSMEQLIAAYDYLYYIFNEQGSSYKAPLITIFNKMQITVFLIGELVILFHLFLSQRKSPAFASC